MNVPAMSAERRLQEALAYSFTVPVTAYLSDVLICSGCALGRVHHDARVTAQGQFMEGHRIRTSAIQGVFYEGHFWIIRTKSQSRYVLVSFHAHGGESSWVDFMMEYSIGVHSASLALVQALSKPELWLSVTAFMVDVWIECDCACGRVYADVLERVADGTALCTGEIDSLVMRQGYWTVKTIDTEWYVLVNFAGPAGKRSFYNFARLMANGLFRDPRTLQ